MDNEEIKAFLQAHADAKYAAFNGKLIPGAKPKDTKKERIIRRICR